MPNKLVTFRFDAVAGVYKPQAQVACLFRECGKDLKDELQPQRFRVRVSNRSFLLVKGLLGSHLFRKDARLRPLIEMFWIAVGNSWRSNRRRRYGSKPTDRLERFRQPRK